VVGEFAKPCRSEKDNEKKRDNCAHSIVIRQPILALARAGIAGLFHVQRESGVGAGLLCLNELEDPLKGRLRLGAQVMILKELEMNRVGKPPCSKSDRVRNDTMASSFIEERVISRMEGRRPPSSMKIYVRPGAWLVWPPFE
jgi:hypothetical protein